MAVPAANKANMASLALRVILFPFRRSPYRLANKATRGTTLLELGTSRYQIILWTHHKSENRRAALWMFWTGFKASASAPLAIVSEMGRKMVAGLPGPPP